jgi:hypothetical protein
MTNAIDRDPTQEAILYQPQGWPSRTASKGPLSNPTFARNALASGGIIAPADEAAAVRRTDWWVGLLVILLGTLGVGAIVLSYVVGKP